MDKRSIQPVTPPSLAEKWLSYCMPSRLREPVLGDLWETYQAYASEYGQLHARAWYIKQVVQSSMRFILRYKRGMVMFILSLAMFFGVTLMAMWFSGSLLMFVNVPSLIIVLPVSIAFAIASSSLADFKKAFSVVMSEERSWSASEYLSAQHVFNVMGNSAVMLGWFGVILGAIAMASNIEKEMFADVIGPATSVCLLTLLYGYVVKILCFTATQRIKHFHLVR